MSKKQDRNLKIEFTGEACIDIRWLLATFLVLAAIVTLNSHPLAADLIGKLLLLLR